MKALFIGRFQPFHLGHLKVLTGLSDRYDFIIGIGSAQYGNTYDNPFTLDERIEMIKESLRDSNVKYAIYTIPDIHDYSRWVDHVCSIVPSFDIVLSNNPVTRKLFEEKGFKVENIPKYNRSLYSGREIRRRISKNERWEDLVPVAVVKIIHSIDGVRRIQNLYSSRSQ
ncbi:MAG: nicotinamide-nucleotide adenylyltransferase [Thermoplasmata archaeon]|nr:MAG: nicotinamide-nucleotide adenylyltransferase [Thermoplasmata archaeon]HEC89931.1 nicotinamide-nucleotide adenylyltransferase [Thermoplasmatales archaeon]